MLQFHVDRAFEVQKAIWYSYILGNATVCRQITSPISIRDVEWATQTCLLSFNTIGIWPETMDGTDLSTVAKSNNGKLCATGDDFGKIKLYSHPVTQPKVNISPVLFLKQNPLSVCYTFFMINGRVSLICLHVHPFFVENLHGSCPSTWKRHPSLRFVSYPSQST